MGIYRVTLALISAALIGWFVTDTTPGTLPARNLVCWLYLLGVHICLILIAPRIARHAVTPGARRIWFVVAIGAGCFLLGDLVQLTAIIRRPLAPDIVIGTTLQGVLVEIGLAIFVLGGLTAPIGFTTSRERWRFWMDAATVMAAGVAVGLYVAVGPARTVQTAADLDGLLWKPGLMLVNLFLVTKLVLSREPPMGRAAGTLAVLSAATVTFVQSYPWEISFTSGHLDVLLAITVVSNGLLLGAALVQDGAEPASGHHRTRRSFSMLPYAGIAAVYCVLALTLARHGLDIRAWVALWCAAVCTALVVARQILAFVDNARLVRELNAEVHQRQELAAELHYQAYHDDLTGLANRALFTERLEAAVASGNRVAVLIVDLDDFKPVNDELGHRAGDQLLVEVAGRLSKCVREDDIVARLGGDEFGILLAEALAANVSAVAQRVVGAVGIPMKLMEHDVSVSASVGAAIGKPTEAEALLHGADVAMYAAKRAGKGSFQIVHVD